MKSKKSSLNSPGKKRLRRESNPGSIFIEVDEHKIRADQLITLIKSGKPEERPPCPICGGRPQSDGPVWKCGTCGKQWTKKKHSRPALPQDRPLCPTCQSNKTLSHGRTWWCSECGKQWVKHPQGKK